MSNSYSKLFSIPGAAGFSAAAFLGRLPAGMIGLVVILPIYSLTGSYTIAGAVAAATMAGMAVCAPFSGRLVDRYGQRRILLVSAALNFIAISALIACILFGAPLAMLCIAGAFAGASRLSTGTLARSRWAYVTRTLDLERRARALQAAYAFESVVDEVVFISAPILGTLLCAAVHPLAGLVCCLVSYVAGALALAAQRATQPALVPFAFAENLTMLALALFVAGLAIAPASIAGQVLTERMLPARLLNEGMNIVVTAMILGMAAGGWLAGILIDQFGAYRAGALPAIAALAALVIAMVRARSLVVPLHATGVVGKEG